MTEKRLGLTVIDLFCGAGGFSEGFHQSGFDVVFGIDFWSPACETHYLNGLGETRNLNLLDFDVDDIISLKQELGKSYGEIDILIGSPPCTEFSYAKKGGKGDIEQGMLLVRKHLEFVTLFQPKYWLVENVPRLESVLNKECEGSQQTGWEISYEKLGIPRNRYKELGLEGYMLSIPFGTVYTASDYGACQNRKRFIAGNLDISQMENHKVDTDVDVSFGGLLRRLDKGLGSGKEYAEDPNYPGHKVKRKDIRDLDYDTSLHPMYWEEMRHLKRRHIQYGKMNLPEDLSLPARTIMATSNSSSRESLILATENKVIYQGKKRTVFRQPSVREVACIQGFPMDFQLVADKMNDRYKLVGNAVPCQLSFALAKSILDSIQEDKHQRDKTFLQRYESNVNRLKKNKYKPIITAPRRIVSEAEDIGDIHREFRASERKFIRRKILSSKLENDSCVVIFENSVLHEGKIRGGSNWKLCLQRGIGIKFNRVYLDGSSIPKMLRYMEQPLDRSELKSVLRHLLGEVEKGIPSLKYGWKEFPGYGNSPEIYLTLINKKRLKLPSIALLHEAFTRDIPDIGPIAGPIDLLDGLDAIMLSTFLHTNFKYLQNRRINVSSLRDKGNYPSKKDPRVVPTLENVEVPLVTIMSGLMAGHALKKMYDSERPKIDDGYQTSLAEGCEVIQRWIK